MALPSPDLGVPLIPTGFADNDPSNFGKFRIVAELGQGGMANVFLAVSRGPAGTAFNKLVVVKRLRKNLAEDPDFIAMLIDEARLAARLNHPNVVQTNEVGQIGAEYFIAMEYLDGQALNRIIARSKPTGGVPLGMALLVMIEVLAGLHYAHELADFDGTPLNVVHRDVTPQNIFVTFAGQVKVVDFGIAKAAGRSAETRQGMIKGKVAYMAPEQAMAADVDRRVDVFAAGAVLLELVTGQRLWGKHVDEIQIMTRLIAGDLPNDPKAIKPELDDELAGIIRRALAPKADDRYATAAEFQAALETYARKIGALSATRELGAWVAELYADRREQKRAIIEKRLQQMKELDAGALARANPTLPPSLAAMSGPYPSVTPTSSHTHTKQSATVGAKRKRLAGALAAVLGAGLIVSGLVYALGSRHGGAGLEGAANGAGSNAGASPGVPAGDKIHVGVQTSPADAHLSLDDAPVTNPYVGDVPKDDTIHRFAADAPGFKRATREVTFGQSVDMSIELERDPTRRHPGGAAGGGGGSGGARNGTGGGAPEQGHFGDRDLSKKPTRPIDSADPW